MVCEGLEPAARLREDEELVVHATLGAAPVARATGEVVEHAVEQVRDLPRILAVGDEKAVHALADLLTPAMEESP